MEMGCRSVIGFMLKITVKRFGAYYVPGDLGSLTTWAGVINYPTSNSFERYAIYSMRWRQVPATSHTATSFITYPIAQDMIDVMQ
jgi:hypothetical protein